MKLPTKRRAAKRTLMFETTDNDRVLVGSPWLPYRIIANNKEHATDVALEVWEQMQRGNGT